MNITKISDIRGKLSYGELMSRHTSWRVGGPAEIFFCPDSTEDLANFLKELDSTLPIFWHGVGSNLLVRDGGLPGVVISAAKILRFIERLNSHQVIVGSGLPCTQLAKQCIRWELGPSEFFAGIPGTVGGALAMNAGAYGNETWELVESVKTIDCDGNIHIRLPKEYEIEYRNVTGPSKEWFLSAILRFEKDTKPSFEAMNKMLERRKSSQPLGLPSCGSVFRNPKGDYSARLIEASGLKGYRIGGAEVSEKHANFIINRDNATAKDIEALIEYVRNTVFVKQGVSLKHEVHIVGKLLDD
ncbi:MAG: UDP-N-acetylenolpyruvoylglucosamine reductase [Gammaproteobacteria bacterium]|nr:UDP-N-acetylenolpyruvoylglucosamine reductase [Gammaproteobacteria bacterium]|tara:strand:+ start:3287 stop:4186 length:900 start_codon:yes stop_codon:yes gene_type:complete